MSASVRDKRNYKKENVNADEETRRRAEYTVRNVKTTTTLFRANTSYMVVPVSLLVIVISYYPHRAKLQTLPKCISYKISDICSPLNHNLTCAIRFFSEPVPQLSYC